MNVTKGWHGAKHWGAKRIFACSAFEQHVSAAAI